MWTKISRILTQLWPPAFLRGRQLCSLTLAFAAGILLSAWWRPLPLLALALAALLVLVTALLLWLRPAAAWPCLLLAMLAVGLFAARGMDAALDDFPLGEEAQVQILGWARGDSLYRGEGRYRLLLQVEQVNGQPWSGRVYVYYEGGALLRGDTVLAEGSVMSSAALGNFAAFDYNAYLRRQGIAASISCYYGGAVTTVGGWAAERSTVRGRLLEAIDAAGGEQAGLIKGLFLGDRSDLSFAERTTLSLAGVSHAFAVSGLHVGFLVVAAVFLVGKGRKRRWLRLGVVLALLLFYTRLTGWPASVLRASLMALCLQLSQALEEKNDPYTGLCLAMLLCLLYRPLWLFDAGFQLSFVAAFGILYLLPIFQHLLGVSKKAGYLRQLLAVTLAASFATMPLVSYYFYHISLVGWLVSPLFVLGAAAIVLLSLLAALFAIFSVGLATLPVYACAALAYLLSWLSEASLRLPLAYIQSGRTPLYAVLLFYLALLTIPLWWKRVKRQRLWLLLLLLLLVLLLTFAPALGRPGGLLEVVFLDVGQGDAALVITPGGATILIDGGGYPLSPGTLGEQVLIPYLQARGISSIDLMISSHPDLDHMDGLLTVLEYLPVKQLLYADAFADNASQQRLLAAAEDNGAALTAGYAGLSFLLEDDLYLSIYNPAAGTDYSADPNNGSIVCLLSYGRIDFLFTGDSAFAPWSEIPAAEVVKLPHHGSAAGGAYDESAYAQLEAEAVVLSVGGSNRYGHPHATVVEYWQGKAEIYRTDWQGSITFYTDGQTWWAVTYAGD